MAQRALIIGLGSTGFDVCKHLVERVQWEVGGLEKAPWLEILVLETEPLVGDGPLERNGVHVRINENDYTNLLNNAGSFRQQLDLERWWHPETLLSLGDRAVTKGAGNIRMVGRLAFLFPNNLERIRDEIKVRLERLAPARLTPLLAQQARGPLADGSNPPIALSNDIAVYVVGTLCGGTCSGSFLDLGYLLFHEFKRNHHPIQRVGIFALPHLAYDPKRWARRRANSYAALTELNHYMAGNPYTAQYSLYPGQPAVVRSISPYDSTYLVQPRGGDEPAFEATKLVISQFLHSDIFTSDAAQIGVRMIDGSASVAEGDRNGSPQAYYTFGMSAVEIPGYLIAQGCCYKLGLETFDEYLAPRPNAPAEADAFRVNRLGISAEKVGEKLLRDPQAVEEGFAAGAIKERIKAEVAAASNNARNAGGSAASELAKVEEKINRAFAVRSGDDNGQVSDAAATSKLPPHFVPMRVQANAAGLILEYEDTLRREMQLALIDPARGLGWCREILDNAESWLLSRLADLKSGKAADDLERAQKSTQSDLKMARERIEACATDPFLAAFFGTRRAIDRHLQEYEEAANRAFTRRLESSLVGAERDLWTKILPLVTAMKARIVGAGGDDGSLLQQARMLRDQLKARLEVLDTTLPAINGVPIFETKKTIGDAYDRTWNIKNSEERATAKRAFLLSWDALPRLDENGQIPAAYSFFSPSVMPLTGERLKRHIEENVEKMAQAARGRDTFAAVINESVLHRLTPPDTEMLRDVWQKGTPLLHTNRQNPTYNHTGANEANFVFMPPAQGNEAALTALRNSIDVVRAGGDALQFEANANPQSLLFLRAFGGFPLAIIEGFQDDRFEQTNFRYSFNEVSKSNATLWSRNDVREWHPLYGDKDENSDWRKGLFLSGLALSKGGTSGEPIIKRSGAGYVYKPDRPFSPLRDRMEFGSDLRGIAHLLRREEDAQNRLLTDVTQVRHDKSVEEIATSLEDLYNAIGPLRLQNARFAFSQKATQEEQVNPGANNPAAGQGGANGNAVGESNVGIALTPIVDAEEAHRLIIEFWRIADPELVKRLRAPFKQEKFPPHVQWREKDKQHFNAGYYCTYPTHEQAIFLSDTPADVPNRCEVCNQSCR